MIPNLNLTIRIFKVDGATPIHMKPDGKRFQQAFTLKLNKDTDHVMAFKLRPATCIR
ncbi:hypothetical protein DPMN_084845 [Dreissena polymorpha]|uniref:CB1 cannabinoid receptor-interacting protein 1 n=1 Tax=Dreissena polymorpha TaxID=45954 RepID=A0A9D3YEK2_DREPO|nr:hypothetical protein DPMN_084845 [Dreissena polymorpha]